MDVEKWMENVLAQVHRDTLRDLLQANPQADQTVHNKKPMLDSLLTHIVAKMTQEA